QHYSNGSTSEPIEVDTTENDSAQNRGHGQDQSQASVNHSSSHHDRYRSDMMGSSPSLQHSSFANGPMQYGYRHQPMSHSPYGHSPRDSGDMRPLHKGRGHAHTSSLGMSRMEIQDLHRSREYGHSHSRSMDYGRSDSGHPFHPSDMGHSHTPSLEYPRDMHPYQRKDRGHSHTPSLEMPPIPGQPMHRSDERHQEHLAHLETELEPPQRRHDSQEKQQQHFDATAAAEALTSSSATAAATTHGVDQDQAESPSSSPTPRTPQSTSQEESLNELANASELCARSSVGPMEEDNKSAVAVV
ncbi:hypothetical protein BGW38_009315, partial [Lunasporangiospora selenospora]